MDWNERNWFYGENVEELPDVKIKALRTYYRYKDIDEIRPKQIDKQN